MAFRRANDLPQKDRELLGNLTEASYGLNQMVMQLAFRIDPSLSVNALKALEKADKATGEALGVVGAELRVQLPPTNTASVWSTYNHRTLLVAHAVRTTQAMLIEHLRINAPALAVLDAEMNAALAHLRRANLLLAAMAEMDPDPDYIAPETDAAA